MLAFLPRAQLERLLRGWSPPHQTEHTIVGRAALVDELALVRTKGFAENRQESEVGVVSIAAPIRDDTGSTIAAMSVAGPADRMDHRRDQLADAVVTMALATSRRLGYRGRR